MVYNNKFFKIDGNDRIVKLIRMANGFGTIVLKNSGEYMASSVPMFVNDSCTFLEGHLSSLNPMANRMDNEDVIVIFILSDHYISADWYGEEIPVPTWNYLEVQALGRIHILHDETDIIRIVDSLTDIHEKSIDGKWSADWRMKEYSSMLKQITAFRIEITKIEGKAKLSQNHKIENIENVISNLKKVKTHKAAEFVDIMDRHIHEGKD